MFRPLRLSFILVLVTALSGNAGAATLEITGPAGASLSLNGTDLGFLPLDGPLELDAGYYTIESRLPGHIDFKHELRLLGDNDWQRLAVRLVPFSRKTAWSSNILFAGLGQHYLGKSTRGYIYNLAEAGGLLVALFAELERSNLRKDYLDIMDKYNSSINADDITRLRQSADQTYSDMKDQEDLRNTGLMVAAGAIVVSVLDAIIFFPAVEAGVGPAPLDTGSPEVGFRSDPDPWSTAHVAVKLEF
jgi:hypothetical protein